MHKFNRSILSLFMSVIMFFVSLFSTGELPFTFDMPELSGGEYGKWVNPFVGTGGTPYMSGMTFPGATSPYGAVKLSPDTCTVGNTKIVTRWGTGGYTYAHGNILGFSHTRLSGTGAADMGHFRVTPVSGNKKASSLMFLHSDEIATAGYYAVNLPEIGCLAELSATTHTGAHRYTFRTSKDARIMLDVTSFMPGGSASDGEIFIDKNSGEIMGKATVKTQFADRYGGLTAYFTAVFNTPFKSHTVYIGNEDGASTHAEGDNIKADFNFGNKKNEPIEMKLAISFVSIENARHNLSAETQNLDFDGICQKAFDTWDSYLSRIDIEADDEIKTNFYTALYHSMLMPSTYTDVNGDYAGFGGTVKKADGFTYLSDMSLWDTFRTVAPLQTLIAPEIQNDMLQSLLLMAEAHGIFPRWPSGTGETNSMYGSPADMIITESFLKGFDGFDYEKAYGYIKKAGLQSLNGKTFIELYDEYGYCPADITDAKCVSRTLEYAYADYCISLLAKGLGKTEDASFFLNRSKNYKNIWDESSKCFRAKNSDGSLFSPFNENTTQFIDDIFGTDYAYGFCEGSARHWQWGVLYDPNSMIALYGGNESFTKTLDAFMSDANTMRSALIPSGGYWHGNQHDLHAIYLFNDASHPELSQKWARWAMDTRYAPTPDGLDGNDDGGTISAWYVLSAVGIYPVAGTDLYWIGSPCVNSAVLNLGGGKTLTVTAENQSKDNIYVQSVTLNGEKLTEPKISHNMLINGGTLTFTMGNTPSANGGF